MDNSSSSSSSLINGTVESLQDQEIQSFLRDEADRSSSGRSEENQSPTNDLEDGDYEDLPLEVREETTAIGLPRNKDNDFGCKVEFFAKVLVPIGRTPVVVVKKMLENIFEKTAVKNCQFLRQVMIPRADYEEQIAELRYILNVENTVETEMYRMMFTFLQKFCLYSGIGLHDQFFLTLPRLPQIMDSRAQNHSISVMNIVIGNLPSPGLFFVRGDYISSPNVELSNQAHIDRMRGRNDSHIRGDKDQFRPADKFPTLSWSSFEHDKRVMNVFFAIKFDEMRPDGLLYCGYRMVVRYESIIDITADFRENGRNSLYFRLKYPPQVWEAVPYAQNGTRVLNINKSREWVRVLQWPGSTRGRSTVGADIPGAYSVGCSTEALADCQAVQICYPKVDGDHRKMPSYTLLEIISRIAARSQANVLFGTVFSQLKKLPIVPEVSSVGSFRADYALKALISRGSVVTDQLFEYVEDADCLSGEHIFLRLVRWSMQECQRAAEEALENLLSAIDERRVMDILLAFRHMYNMRIDAYRRAVDENCADDLLKQVPKNCVMVRKVMVTPLRTLFMAPEIMMTNRVVRHFGAQNALRCVFRDDSGNRLNMKDFIYGSNTDQCSSIVAQMIQKTLSHGLEIHDRHYYFLAWSNSQMRDHGCYMYSPPEGETIDTMREWMGDFSGSKSVPKLMSRMGQCFTQAQPTVTLTPSMWKLESDVEGGIGHPETGEKYTFSDGCGRIAPSLARIIAYELDLEIIPSCFQVRFKGMKGVLAIDPILDHCESGPKVIFRKSQQKFHDEKSEDVLEIVKHAMPSPVCLNRPMITILDQVAQKQSSALHRRLCQKIHYYLEKELSCLGEMLMTEKDAAEQLKQRVNLPVDFIFMRNCGFTFTNEPFMRKMLVAIYRYNITNHLGKAKIFLPSNMGRSMYGIVDETGLLQYGQVFIQYSHNLRNPSDKPLLYTGKVLITKNPCHVPGDVRVFDAVDQPSLRHLFDVVVFPRYGPRPHPDEMAGSDLDGDEYSVIFDQDISFLYNEEAMVFPKASAPEFDAPPSTEDMADFFLKYLKQDSIGKMSNAHLIMADVKGLYDEVSCAIARKCSIAVDFPKSGEPAEPLANHEQSNCVPDYMASGYKPLYRSKHLNGQLYRKAKKVDEVLQLTENVESLFENEIDKILLPSGCDLFEDCDDLKLIYKKMFDDYSTRMQQLLDEYGISDEAAVVCGHITSLKRLTAMERDDYSFYHTDKIVELRYARIFNYFRELFFREFGGEDENSELDSDGTSRVRANAVMHLKARRWYQLVYSNSSRRRRARFRSFPWIVWDVLAAFKREKLMCSTTFQLTKSPLSDLFENVILHFIDTNEDSYHTFCLNIRQEPGIVQRYAIAYEGPLLRSLFLLNHWLEKELFFDFAPIKFLHVALLFIRFCRGKHQGADGVCDNGGVDEVFIPMMYKPDNPATALECAPFSIADTLLNFLRYLSSQKFALAQRIDLKVDDEKVYPVLMRSHLWVPLSQLAFRTYHHIAVSGRFDALHLTEQAPDVISESRDPIVVPGALIPEKADEQNYPRKRMVVETLRDWTGIDFLSARIAHFGRRRDLYISSFGTVMARQRLARLLLMPVEELLQAIREDTIPSQIRDESL